MTTSTALPAALRTAPATEDCQVVELRQYTLVPGQRDTLIGLFDTHFVEPQEESGMRVIGQFRDLGDADRFVWMRGFADMDSRPRSLESFYFGPVWAQHRGAANPTMIDSDNVLLLQPAWHGSSLRMSEGERPQAGDAPASSKRRAFMSVFHLKAPAGDELLSLAKSRMTETLRGLSASEVGWYASHPGENNFPRLPVREGENVLVAVAVLDDAASLARLQRDDPWCELAPTLDRWLAQPTQLIFLEPTGRSLL